MADNMGLLGLDPASLQALMAQFQPSDQDKQRARTAALAAAGFGILGAKGVNGMQALGQGGLLGVQSYNQDLKDAQAQRLQNLQAAMQLGNLVKQQRGFDALNQWANGGDTTPQQSGPPAMAASANVGGSGMGGGSAALFGPSSANLPPMPQPAGNVPMFTPPNPSSMMPRDLKRVIAGSGDLGKAADMIAKFSEAKLRDGMAVGYSGQPFYKETDSGMQYFNPDGTPGAFIPYGGANTQAAAQRVASIEGAKAGAIEAQQFPYRTGSVTGPTGAPVSGFLKDIYGTPNGAQGMPQGTPGTNTVSGPNPAALKGIESEQSAMGDAYAKQAADVDAQAQAAQMMKGRIAEMRQLLTQFSPNAAAPIRQRVAEIAQSMNAPNSVVTRIAGGDVAAMQQFMKQSVQNAFESARTQMGGVPRAYQEIEYQIKSNPSVALLPEANNKILDFLDGMSNYQIARQSAKDQWLANNGTMRGFAGAFNKAHPSTEFFGGQDQQSNQAAQKIPADGTTGTTKDGRRVIVRGGIWQPL